MKEVEPPRGSGLLPAAGVLAVVLGGALLYRFAVKPDAPPAPASSGSAAATAYARCKPVTTEDGFVIGDTRRTAARKAEGDEAPSEVEPERDDLLQPFAVVLGRAVSYQGGFAMGVMGDVTQAGETGQGSAAFVAMVGPDGSTGKTVKLIRARGDLDPPVVAAAPGSELLFAATLEPNASSRAIRLASIRGTELTWGPEIPEDTDPSIAIDLAVTARKGVVVWDTDDESASYVHVAGFSVDAPGTIVSQRRATGPEKNADSPRIVATNQGFYLAYLVHEGETARDAVVDRGDRSPRPAPSATAKASSDKPPKKKKKKTDEPKTAAKPPRDDTREEGDVDETKGGESVSQAWIEVIPLDETGAQANDPIRVTPKGATVIGFDIATGPGDTLLVAYRDDDAPTGGGGGIVHIATIRAGGVGAVYESEDPVPSDGIPTLLSGWLAVPTLYGPDFIARLGADGLPAEALTKEPSLGRGEPIAANAESILVTEPEGAAMRFKVVQCGALPPAPDKPAPPAASTGP